MRLNTNSSFLSSSSIVFAGAFVVNILNYVFTLLMSRILGIESFGEVATVISLLTVISVPSSAFAMLMAREVASRKGNKDDEIHALFMLLQRYALIISVVVWILFLALVPVLSYFFHISFSLFLLFSIVILFLTPTSLQSGTLQGLQEFFALSKQNIFGACIKLVISLALVSAGFSVTGVIFALVCAQVMTWLYGAMTTKKKFTVNPASKKTPINVSFHKLYWSILLTSFLLALLSNTDLLLAKHFLPPLIAGEYGALASLGNIIVYGIGAFTTVLLPMISFTRAQGEDDRRIFVYSLLIIGLAAITAWVAFSFFPGFFISLLFGAKYLPVAPFLGAYAFAEGCIALSIALINYFVAVRNTSFMYVLGLGIVAEMSLIFMYHASIESIVEMLGISAFGMLALLTINLLSLSKKTA